MPTWRRTNMKSPIFYHCNGELVGLCPHFFKTRQWCYDVYWPLPVCSVCWVGSCYVSLAFARVFLMYFCNFCGICVFCKPLLCFLSMYRSFFVWFESPLFWSNMWGLFPWVVFILWFVFFLDSLVCLLNFFLVESCMLSLIIGKDGSRGLPARPTFARLTYRVMRPIRCAENLSGKQLLISMRARLT